MKIAWIATQQTEAEHDIVLCGRPGLEIIMCCSEPTTDPIFQLAATANSAFGRLKLMRDLSALQADLYIFRYPYWVDDSLPIPQPAVAWASEQGPTRHWAIRTSRLFEHVAFNAKIEEQAYREALPGKVLHYLPFGCTARSVQRPDPKFASDLIADGRCHYACSGHCGTDPPHTDKHTSVDAMVIPLIRDGFNLKVWGLVDWGPVNRLCGWMGVPEIKAEPDRFYGGMYAAEDYASVYASCKVYIGVSWNWRLGGYGTKLARALVSGIPVLWHRTVGMELDGLVTDEHLEVSTYPDETVCKARELLGDEKRRIELGRAGRDFALRNWEWGDNLLRLAKDIL